MRKKECGEVFQDVLTRYGVDRFLLLETACPVTGTAGEKSMRVIAEMVRVL